MIQRMKNTLLLQVANQQFTTCSNFKCYIQQYEFEKDYVPTVENDTQVSVVIPYSDAMSLQKGFCNIQLFWTDANNNPRATKEVSVDVEKVIPSGGYNV